MPEIAVRKYAVTVEEIFHEGGPAAAVPLKRGAALAVIAFAITWGCLSLIQLVSRFQKSAPRKV